ncbi:hypothetical protein [Stenotrophomonas geniculata]
MSKIDPHDRIDLTGPWAGFGFQAGHNLVVPDLQHCAGMATDDG